MGVYKRGLGFSFDTPPSLRIWAARRTGHRRKGEQLSCTLRCFGSSTMELVLNPRQCPGGGSAATSVHFGWKIMWPSYLCLIAVSFQFLMQTAGAAPVLASSFGYCDNITVQASPIKLDCCLPAPKSTQAKMFVPPRTAILRERKPAHVLAQDPVYVAKYNEAYAKMRALPKGDPLSFDSQWKIHCAFCNEAYLQRMTPGPTNIDVGIPLQVHYSWLFLPWHRMLLYFHEKALGMLINDTTFALPFWNWDNQLDSGANTIPALFLDGFKFNNSALTNPNRNKLHLTKIMPLSYTGAKEKEATGPEQLDEEIKDESLSIIYTNMMEKVTSRDFLGGPYSLGADFSSATVPDKSITPGESGGSETLHNTAHEWVGLINDPNHPDNEDMGNFIYAGKDPMFYTHHANVDRMWDVWKTLPDTVTPSRTRRREDFRDLDFLDTEFTFYDENRDWVIVKVRDTLDSAKLGVTYTEMLKSDSLWRNYRKKPPASRTTEQTWKPTDYPVAAATDGTTYVIYDDPASFMVARRTPNGTDLIGKPVKHVNQLAEGVMMEEVKIPHNRYVRLDAFLNMPSADNATDFGLSDYVGTFTHLPSGLVNTTNPDLEEEEEFRIVNINFVVSPSLARLGISDYNTPITMTIVPKMRFNKTIPITFTSLRQEFQ